MRGRKNMADIPRRRMCQGSRMRERETGRERAGRAERERKRMRRGGEEPSLKSRETHNEKRKKRSREVARFFVPGFLPLHFRITVIIPLPPSLPPYGVSAFRVVARRATETQCSLRCRVCCNYARGGLFPSLPLPEGTRIPLIR